MRRYGNLDLGFRVYDVQTTRSHITIPNGRRAQHIAVLGKTGNLDGDDVLDILLARAETAEFVTAKLWREFVSPDPDEAEVKRIAARFRDSRYDIFGGWPG